MKIFKTIIAVAMLMQIGLHEISAQEFTGYMGKKGLVGGGINTLYNLKPGLAFQFEYVIGHRSSLGLHYDNLSFSNYEVRNENLTYELNQVKAEDMTFSARAMELHYNIYVRRGAPMGVYMYFPFGVASIKPTQTSYYFDYYSGDDQDTVTINNRFSTFYTGLGIGVNRIITDNIMISFSGVSRFNIQTMWFLGERSIEEATATRDIQNLYKMSAMAYLSLNLELKVSYLF